MIAPQVSFDLAMKEKKQPPPIVKKPVSFFDDKQAPAPAPVKQQAKQQAPPAPAHAHAPAPAHAHAPSPAHAHAPAHAHVQVSEGNDDDITTELEEMSIGLQGLMEGNVKATKAKRQLSKALLENLAKMREKKALKREEAKKTKLVLQQAPSPSPSPQQPSSNLPIQHQSYENLNELITTEFEKLYSAKESIRQREKAIRIETKQKMLAKLIAQQKLQAPAPAPQPQASPPPKVESTVGKKLRYKMSPYGGIETYYED